MFREKLNRFDEEIDWGDVWNRQVMSRRKSGKVINRENQWQSKENADQYWEYTVKTQHQRIAVTLNEMEILPDSRILDIGAGPGLLAIPLAKRVAHITAIEPMDGMVEVLREKVMQGRINNINWIQKYWEDVDIQLDLDQPYDLVLASLSLNMLGIEKAIGKMVEASSRMVCLYWFAGEPSWEIHSKKLIPLLHHTPFVPMPKSDILINVLYRMGIYPHTKVFNYRFNEQFSSFQALLDDFIHYFKASSRHQRNIIKKYLENLLNGFMKTNGKEICFPSSFTCVKIFWEKNFPSGPSQPKIS